MKYIMNGPAISKVGLLLCRISISILNIVLIFPELQAGFKDLLKIVLYLLFLDKYLSIFVYSF